MVKYQTISLAVVASILSASQAAPSPLLLDVSLRDEFSKLNRGLRHSSPISAKHGDKRKNGSLTKFKSVEYYHQFLPATIKYNRKYCWQPLVPQEPECPEGVSVALLFVMTMTFADNRSVA